MAYDFVN